jgi:hypothetical protein
MSVDFVAQIDLLPTAEGGRAGALLSGEWRTVLCVNDQHWSARLSFAGRPGPGETFVAEVELLMPAEAIRLFPAGAEFTVWEGGIKGTGRVLSSTI